MKTLADKKYSTAVFYVTFQAVFIMGICMFLTYYGYYELWEVFVPTTFSAALMISLVGLKVYYEELSPRRTTAAAGVGEEDTAGDSEPRTRRERSARARDEEKSTSEMQPLMSSW